MDKTQLLKMINNGYSTYEIARETNKCQTSVRHWLTKYGLKTKRAEASFCCKVCGETEEYKMMNTGNDKKSHTLCKRCHCKKTVERFRKNKQLAVDYKGGECQKCGYKKSIRALVFHHRDATQKDINFDSNYVKKLNFKKVKKELDKCDLLCANCHAETHDEIEGI